MTTQTHCPSSANSIPTLALVDAVVEPSAASMAAFQDVPEARRSARSHSKRKLAMASDPADGNTNSDGQVGKHDRKHLHGYRGGLPENEEDGPKELTLIPNARLEAPPVMHGLSSAAIDGNGTHEEKRSLTRRVSSGQSRNG